MRKLLAAAVISSFLFCSLGLVALSSAAEKPWKGEVAADKKAIKSKKAEIKKASMDAKTEELQLRNQLREAVRTNNFERAKELRAQLKTMHRENVQQMHQDKKELRTMKKEMRRDLKAIRKAPKT